jgi:hypothetical protein
MPPLTSEARSAGCFWEGRQAPNTSGELQFASLGDEDAEARLEGDGKVRVVGVEGRGQGKGPGVRVEDGAGVHVE